MDLQSSKFRKSSSLPFCRRCSLHTAHCQGVIFFFSFLLLLLFLVVAVVVVVIVVVVVVVAAVVFAFFYFVLVDTSAFPLQAVPHFNIDFESYMHQVTLLIPYIDKVANQILFKTFCHHNDECDYD